MKKKTKGYSAGGRMKSKMSTKMSPKMSTKMMAKGGKTVVPNGESSTPKTIARGSGAARTQYFRKNG